MKGTEKQIRYAEDIINESISNLSSACEEKIPELQRECIDEQQLEKDLARNEYIVTAYTEAIKKIADDAARIINSKSILMNGSELRRELVKAVRIKNNGKIVAKLETTLEKILK